jgi:hypothetical protein
VELAMPMIPSLLPNRMEHRAWQIQVYCKDQPNPDTERLLDPRCSIQVHHVSSEIVDPTEVMDELATPCLTCRRPIGGCCTPSGMWATINSPSRPNARRRAFRRAARHGLWTRPPRPLRSG